MPGTSLPDSFGLPDAAAGPASLAPEPDAFELPDTAAEDTPAPAALSLPDTVTEDVPEPAALTLPSTETDEVPEPAALSLPGTGTDEVPEPEALSLPRSSVSDAADPARSFSDPGPGPSTDPLPAVRPASPASAAPASKPPKRMAKLLSRFHVMRLGVLAVVIGLVAAGLAAGGASGASPESTVEAFLLAWQQGHYQVAARYTDGQPAAVAADLQTAYNQLDAAALYLTMGSIKQSGGTASATFRASVDLGEDGAPWTYTGWFPLRSTRAGWKIQWSLSDINPGLRAGTRLAVRTTTPPRAQVLDSDGNSLQQPSTAYVAGVEPGRLANPTATATALASVTGLNEGQLFDQIQAGSSQSFLGLVTLSPSSWATLGPRLRQVPGLVIQTQTRRLFNSIASDVVGSVGTEIAPAFRQYGVAYQPGETAGLSGLQQYYQRRLVGSPTTEVVVEDTNGRIVSVLAKWSGPAGQPVRTTISSAAQQAANQALGTTGNAAAIVAVQTSTGKILAVASQAGKGGISQPDPLNGRYPPGQAFTIVSTAALLGTGLSVGAPVPCTSASDVGGRTFTNDPPARGMGAQPSFGDDFARGCGTAFAGLSRRLDASSLSAAAASFGLGSSWRLPLAAYAGSVPAPSNDAGLAADTIGTGDVQLSPLDLALIAAQVQSGSWHSPELVTSPAGSATTGQATTTAKETLNATVVGTLRTLMRNTVRTGSGHAANLAGRPVYGQAGQAAYPAAGKNIQAYWFVGYRGGVAFAVLELGRRPATRSAVPLGAQFLRLLPSSLLNR